MLNLNNNKKIEFINKTYEELDVKPVILFPNLNFARYLYGSSANTGTKVLNYKEIKQRNWVIVERPTGRKIGEKYYILHNNINHLTKTTDTIVDEVPSDITIRLHLKQRWIRLEGKRVGTKNGLGKKKPFDAPAEVPKHLKGKGFKKKNASITT